MVNMCGGSYKKPFINHFSKN